MTQETMTSEEKRSRSYWGLIWPMVFIVLYVLSIGPAMFFMTRGIVSSKIIIVYEPLLAVAEKGPFGRALAAYINWWRP